MFHRRLGAVTGLPFRRYIACRCRKQSHVRVQRSMAMVTTRIRVHHPSEAIDQNVNSRGRGHVTNSIFWPQLVRVVFLPHVTCHVGCFGISVQKYIDPCVSQMLGSGDPFSKFSKNSWRMIYARF